MVGGHLAESAMKHYLGICLVLVTVAAICFLGIYSCMAAADRTVDHVRDAFAQVFKVTPQITVNQQVVQTQTAPIAELAVVTKEELVTLGFTEHFEVFSYQVPLTEKDLSVQAAYRIKAGFDLHEPFNVEINPTTHQVEAHLPPAKILSVDQVGDLTFHGDDSALNRISDQERQKLLNDLNSAAHAQAEASGLKEDAQNQASQRLQEIFAHNGEKIEMTWTPPVTAPLK
jgi:hypothetical protein